MLLWLPNPPPTWPTIVSDVGIVVLPDVVVNDSPFVRLILRSWPVGTVIITGDHPLAPGFSLAHVALELGIGSPQLYPYMGTVLLSGMVMLVGPAVKFTAC